MCNKCKTVEAPDCKEACESPVSCPCQHRPTDTLTDKDGRPVLAPKGARPVMPQ